MRRALIAPVFLASLLAAGLANAESLVPAGDTYLKLDNTGPFGTAGDILVKNAGNGTSSTVRKGLVSFTIPSFWDQVTSASLDLTVSSFNDVNGAESAQFQVWGVNPSLVGDLCGSNFDESTAKWNDYNQYGYLASNAAACYVPLGTFTVNDTDLGNTVHFSSDALTSWIAKSGFFPGQTSGVSFLITRVTNSGSLNTGFASKENTTLTGPRLTLTHGQNGVDLSAGTTTPLANGQKHFQGELRFPLLGGGYISLPSSDVTFVQDAAGGIQSIAGSVGMPKMNAYESGLIDALGDMTGSSPTAGYQIGYGYPSSFQSGGLPLDPSTKYFYLTKGAAGSSVSWGPLSVSSQTQSLSVVVLDVMSPAFFYYTNDFMGDSWIKEVSVGVSNRRNISFLPEYTANVEPYMTGIDGNLYLESSISIPTSIDSTSVDVTGAVTIDADTTKLAQGGHGFLKGLGVNGDVAVSAGFGPYSVSCKVGGASLLYNNEGDASVNNGHSYVAFVGQFDPAVDQLGGLGFLPHVNATVSGFINSSTTDAQNPSYLILDGQYSFGASFLKQSIAGHVQVQWGGGQAPFGVFNGTAKFAGTTVNVNGNIHPGYATFSGSISGKYAIGIGHAYFNLGASFDSRKKEVDLSATGKVCIDNLGCGGAGINDLSINSNGQIHLCLGYQGASYCQTLD